MPSRHCESPPAATSPKSRMPRAIHRCRWRSSLSVAPTSRGKQVAWYSFHRVLGCWPVPGFRLDRPEPGNVLPPLDRFLPRRVVAQQLAEPATEGGSPVCRQLPTEPRKVQAEATQPPLAFVLCRDDVGGIWAQVVLHGAVSLECRPVPGPQAVDPVLRVTLADPCVGHRHR